MGLKRSPSLHKKYIPIGRGEKVMRKRRFLPFLFLLLFLLLVSFSAPAEEGQELSAAQLGAFFDGAVRSQLINEDVAGATVSFVRDGEITFARGYGLAKVKAGKRVAADSTLFRPGSVSKLFIWTALMRLSEEGKVDLNDDINKYLKEFKIPKKFGEPITLKDLMTHSPGFEERGMGMMAEQKEDLMPLSKYLKEERPKRVRPPGEISAYSNYGTGLAGLAIENVSGTPYENYIERNIFQPLGMEKSTFLQPLPRELKDQMSGGYSYEGGIFKKRGFEYLQLSPAGALSATAVDMAKFMIAMLNEGQYRDRRILKSETVRTMRTSQLSHHPLASGWAHGFMEYESHGIRVLWHGGDTQLFHSGLFLLPRQEIGLFVSYNTTKGIGLPIQLFESFMDERFDPQPSTTEAEIEKDFRTPLKTFTGSYLSTRSNFSTVEKVTSLINPIMADVGEDGFLKISGISRGMTQWRRTGELRFDQVHGSGKLFFKKDEEGRIEYLFIKNNPTVALMKLPWWRSYPLQYGVGGGALLFFALSLFVWIINPIYRRVYGAAKKSRDLLTKFANGLDYTIATLYLLFALGFFIASSDPAMKYGLTTEARVITIVGLIASALVVLRGLFLVREWWKGIDGLPARLHSSLFVLVGLIFIWWLNYWNLSFW